MSKQPPEYGVAPPMHEVPPSPRWPWVLLLVVAVLAVGGVLHGGKVVDAVREAAGGMTSGEVAVAEPTGQEPPPAPGKRVVVFEVTGTGTAFTVATTVGASVQNETGVRLPWTRTVEVPADELSKSVMLVVVAGADGAEVHGRYTIDGTTVREGKASGPYGVLTITDS
ncbi:MmpS family transport accessory protein [Lentzea sp. NPDC042327]|uniref:MmpS family transport accessory protein n=1 Tax=Lentzea sp. NPDC042327 TaxID=3154801 RepID=UPI0033C907B6